MPSKSRKKIKGQARKAKAKAAAADNSIILRASPRPPNLNNSNCTHGQEVLPDVCYSFMTSFFKLFIANMNLEGVITALNDAYDKSPEAVNNDNYREICKKSLICNGTLSLLQTSWDNSFGCAAAVMIIDSYVPSSPMSPGVVDQRDAKVLMTNLDILGGCRRSLVKYFVKQIPCKCLDELYSQVRSTTTKTGMCGNCKEMKARSSLYICTGCKRMQYCSKACQLTDVQNHKEFCKGWQMHDAI